MAAWALLICYSATFLLSAALLFSVQPMIARMVLPLYGGSPAVWTTCMVFFQAALLAGYGYAYGISLWLSVRRQTLLHLAVVALPLLLLPMAVPAGWVPPATSNPAPSLLMLLVLVAGAPFFVVSTTAPLLQRWFAETAHPSADDPYFLYAVSNAGSMAALLSYPVVVEPALRLGQQVRWWAVGYFLLALLVAGCAALAWRWPRSVPPGEAPERGGRPADPKAAPRRRARRRQRQLTQAAASSGPRPSRQLTWIDRLWWVALATVPSSWMLAVTARLTTDIAPIPLLWVIPLALYLLTFILVFSRRQWIPHSWVLRVFPLAIVVLGTSLIVAAKWWLFLMHLVAFFAGAMACHGELARRRPTTEHLTQFYLWMATGGVLGGAFNAIVAPLVFPVLMEFPLAVAAACALVPGRRNRDSGRADLAALAATTLVIGLLIYQFQVLPKPNLVLAVLVATPVLMLAYAIKQPQLFAVVIAAVLVWELYDEGPNVTVLDRRRSFFGVHTVVQDKPRMDEQTGRPLPTFRRLYHGTTQHGIQDTDPGRACQPMAYFHRSGPLGDVFAAWPPSPPKPQPVAVIGLGTGATACYVEPGRTFTFYEIDPVVKQLAETPDYFTYLSGCCGRENYQIVLGDGRLMIARAPDHHYGLIILDAFSSDAIPTHLLTLEAVQLYLQKLTDPGLLVFHVSNRHLNLPAVLGDLAPAVGMQALVCRDALVSDEEKKQGKAPSTWVVMARRRRDFHGLDRKPRWQRLRPQPQSRPWTDDFTHIFSILRWNPEDVARGQ